MGTIMKDTQRSVCMYLHVHVRTCVSTLPGNTLKFMDVGIQSLPMVEPGSTLLLLGFCFKSSISALVGSQAT